MRRRERFRTGNLPSRIGTRDDAGDAVLDPRRGRTLGLEIRFGLHTGELELAGSEIGGIAIHTGARMAAKAGPGEVLASRQT